MGGRIRKGHPPGRKPRAARPPKELRFKQIAVAVDPSGSPERDGEVELYGLTPDGRVFTYVRGEGWRPLRMNPQF